MTVLHVWHHFITLILVWTCLQSRVPSQWSAGNSIINISSLMGIPEILNAGVHVPMYYYYLMCEMKREVWWKRYLTLMQIFQFILVNVLHCISFYYNYFLADN